MSSPEAASTDIDDALIPARMLHDLVYCPRSFWLEHVAGEWDDNMETLQGNRVHRRVDARATELPPAGELPEGLHVARSVSVGSAREGIVAKCDLVETDDGRVSPVDYKRGSAPDRSKVPEGAWPADRVQVGAQALALREAGYDVSEAVLYYAQSKTRVRVAVDEALVADVRAAVTEARRVQLLVNAPPPLVASKKCPRCSLVGICLPDEITSLCASPEDRASAGVRQTAETSEDADAANLDGGAESATEPETTEKKEKARVRRLVAATDDCVPLYVQAHGATIGREGDCLRVKLRDGTTTTARLRELSHVNVFGNVTITAPALQELCQRGIDVALFGFGGWHYGSVGGFPEKNVLLRVAQFACAADPARCVTLAREFVAGKVLNSRTLLRRNASEPPAEALATLKALAAEALRMTEIDRLLGVEGAAARIYFEQYARLLAPRSGVKDGEDTGVFAFDARNRRPPRDPVNAMLSFGYALLAKDCRIALKSVGFDPMVGVYHRPRHGRPALALDLMEEFRPLVVDSTVLSVVNTEVVRPGHFVRAAGGCALNDDGRRALIAAYERRMETAVTHPVFGYTLSYRRVLEVQARLLARTIQGEIEQYPSFRTR